MDFNSKVVLITGGAGGIGEAMGRAFLKRGAKVSLCDINVVAGKKILQDLQKEFGDNNVIFSKCDVSKDEDFEAAYNECEKQLGTIDILCNNAGFISKNFTETMGINFGGVVRGTELAMKRMGKHNGGNGGFVVNTGSVAGLIQFPGFPYYCASKAAVINYSRSLGHEFHYNYSGVSVLCFCPGAVDTTFGTAEVLLKGSINSFTDQFLKDVISGITVKLPPDELAEAVIRLIEENKTGSVLAIEKDIEPVYVAPPYTASFT